MVSLLSSITCTNHWSQQIIIPVCKFNTGSLLKSQTWQKKNGYKISIFKKFPLSYATTAKKVWEITRYKSPESEGQIFTARSSSQSLSLPYTHKDLFHLRLNNLQSRVSLFPFCAVKREWNTSRLNEWSDVWEPGQRYTIKIKYDNHIFHLFYQE